MSSKRGLPASQDSENPYSMTEKILEERQRKGNYGRTLPQLFVGFLACLTSLSFGTIFGWAHSISHDVKIASTDTHDSDLGWLVSIALLGCCFGVTSCQLLTQQMGPKKVLQVVAPFYILNWWLILIRNINVQLAGRFFLGCLGIAYSTCGENLFQQTVHYGIKRYISVFHGSTMVLGILVSRVIGSVTTNFYLTMICAAIPIFHYVLMFTVPESPVYLYTTSHVAAANSLRWYRGEGNFYEDMANIRKDWDAARQDSDAYRYMLFSKVVYKALLVIIGVTFFQVTSGYYIFMFYSMSLWTGGKIAYNPLMDSSIIAVCFVLTKILWSYLHTVYRWKIRGFLITSCFFSALSLTLVATYLLLEVKEVDYFVSNRWNPMLIVCFFLFFFDMGLNHFPKTLTFEYMPFQMYKKAYLIVQTAHWLFAFFNIYFYSYTYRLVASYSVFYFFAAVIFIGTLFCHFLVVEPKGRSLIQIQLEFGGNPIGTRGALFNQARLSL